MKTKSKKSSNSDTDSESEHELAYYTGDRIKLMQQTLKLIKPKKLLSMTPDCIKDLQLPAIKSLLLEELLGISNKKLRLILAGENLDVESSSSESDIEDKQDVDIISLDDITDGSEIYVSDDNNCMEIELSERERLEMETEKPKVDKKSKVRSNHRKINIVKVKKENESKDKLKKKTIKKEVETASEDPVMNVLNLLELQARARAIRSQLANEILVDKGGDPGEETKVQPKQVLPEKQPSGDEDSNSVIYVSPKSSPVVLVHSESDAENKEVSEEKGDVINKPEDNNSQSKTEEKEKCAEEEYNDDVLIVTEETILDKEPELQEEQVVSNEENTSTWKSRWLESPKVKDVLRTNKIYNNLRQNRRQKGASPTQMEESNTAQTDINEVKESHDLPATEENVNS